MYNNKVLNDFLQAIGNEIQIETDFLKRINETDIDFIPLRAIKTVNLIKKYRINKYLYAVICLFFIILSPLYFMLKLIKNLQLKNKNHFIVGKNIILVSNGRAEYLYSKLEINETIQCININQPMKENHLSIHSLGTIYDYIKAYFYALCCVPFVFFKLEKKMNILQVYVAYEWFLVYFLLKKHCDKIEKIYFANHYDRWASMFDMLFEKKELIMMQHGILPEELSLSYKLKNINIIYTLNERSVMIFKKIFDCKSTIFHVIEPSLRLIEVEDSGNSILLIGQPQSIDREIKLLEYLKNKIKYNIYIKPHPLFDDSKYHTIEGVVVIKDRNFFPNVGVALSYESTLGLEYEASGIYTIWWKGMEFDSIYNKIINREKNKCSKTKHY